MYNTGKEEYKTQSHEFHVAIMSSFADIMQHQSTYIVMSYGNGH